MFAAAALIGCQPSAKTVNNELQTDALYVLRTDIESRSISFENLNGERGAGGQAASPLGVGRKGNPNREFQPGETVELANIEGPGVIRHLWMTTPKTPESMRAMVIRFYWDGQEHPSIEAPIGDFFGYAHGTTTPFQSAVHSVSKLYGMNIWLPMPFRENARITLTNEMDHPTAVFFNIDYTLGDDLPADLGRLHVSFDRSNPTTLTEDFDILPKRVGQGRYIGAVIGVRAQSYDVPDNWWGEGEVKIFLDGDTDFPTINGTGAEDYIGQAFGVQPFPAQYHGANFEIEGENGADYVSIDRKSTRLNSSHT